MVDSDIYICPVCDAVIETAPGVDPLCPNGPHGAGNGERDYLNVEMLIMPYMGNSESLYAFGPAHYQDHSKYAECVLLTNKGLRYGTIDIERYIYSL